jgi:hypothetical protein
MRGVSAEEPDHRVEPRPGGLLALLDVVQLAAHRHVVLGEQQPGELVLARVVPVHGPFGDPRGGGDVPDRRLGNPLLREQPQRGSLNQLLCRGTVTHRGQ